MAQQNNPFSDIWKSFSNFQNNGNDLNEFVSAARRNFDSVISANRALAEGAQAIAASQVEAFKSSAESTASLLKEISSSKDAQESSKKQAEFAQKSFEQQLNSTKEAIDVAAKSNTTAFEILSKQAQENADSINCCKKSTKKAAA